MQRSRAAAPSGFDLYLNDLAFKRCGKSTSAFDERPSRNQ
jgi:hypothetical protein